MAFGRQRRVIDKAQATACVAWFGGAFLAMASVGCADREKPATPTETTTEVWVGTLPGSDVAVALARSEQRAALFFCGGPRSFSNSTHWFSGTFPQNSGFSLADGNWLVSGATVGDNIEGTVGSDSIAESSFSLSPGSRETLSGLYDAQSDCGHIGLIVHQDSPADLPAAQGACLKLIDGSPSIEQVNPVTPVARDKDGGIAVLVGTEPSATLIVHPLLPASG
jgi:hypothetical protein